VTRATKICQIDTSPQRKQGFIHPLLAPRARWTAVLPMLLCFTTGCVTGGFTPPWKKDQTKLEPPKDNIVLTGMGLERMPIDPGIRQELDAGKRLFDQKKYAEAEVVFHKIVRSNTPAEWWEIGFLAPPASSSSDGDSKDDKDKKDKKQFSSRGRGPNPACEMALFYEAECQRLQKNYRSGVDTYMKLLNDFPRNQYTPQTCTGLFEIADHWLEPTRRQMDEYQEQIQGKRWMITPAMYFHWDKDMPTMDAEGHASLVLNTIRLHDIKGPLGRKALLYLGTIHFFRHDYKEVDFYFTQLHQEYPNEKEAPQAIKQSVICKQLMTGGSVYDLRGVEESKKLLLTNLNAYQELARDQDWVAQQLTNINTQQADRDFRIAEFYQRTGHAGSAYFYYELVCRRYAGSEYATKAAQRKLEIRAKFDRERRNPDDLLPTERNPVNPVMQAPPSPIQVPPRALPPGIGQ
jgi:outer membrane protein assembly factor BamD (BamD/ComL family)